MASKFQIVSLPDFSDGDATQWPTATDHKKVDPPHLYLQKLGELWMKHYSPEKRKPGITYYLDKLPKGYAVYERARPSDANHLDKFLYGCPGQSSKRFNSPNDFWPHLNHLQLNKGIAAGCPCRLCKGSPRHSNQSSPSVQPDSSPMIPPPIEKRKPGRPSKATGGLPQQHNGEISKSFEKPGTALLPKDQSLQQDKHNTTIRHIDEEGTPIALRELFERLQKQGTLDIEITEPYSMDWCASQALLPTWIDKIAQQASWIPRQGELVLVISGLPPHTDIEFRANTQAFELFNKKADRWAGYPLWQAAVIGQEPNEHVDVTDINEDSDKLLGLSESGWRIEPLPGPNQPDKSLTSRHKYVSTKHIRPFVLRHRILQNIPMQDWHPTIWNAMLVQSSVVIVGQQRLVGKWPKAQIFCSGIYIGSEFITSGDTVTLRPNTGEASPSFLEVHAITIEYSNLDSEDGGHSIFLEGKAYTRDGSAPRARPSVRPLPTPVRDYEIPLYLRHDEDQNLRVSFNRVLGRCPEAKALHLWLPSGSLSSLIDMTVITVLDAREYSTKQDTRVTDGKSWYWANTRLGALDIPSLNNISASHVDLMRKDRIEKGQKAARVLARPSARHQLEMRQVAERSKALSVEGAMGMMRAADAPMESDAEQDNPQLLSVKDGRTDTPRLESPPRDDEDEHEDQQDNGDVIQVISPSRKRSASIFMDTMDTRTPGTSRLESADSSDDFADAPMLLETFQPNKRSKPIVDG